MASPGVRRVNFEEYVALDRGSEARWEYVNGEAFVVVAALPEHTLVKGNVYAALRAALAGKPCLPLVGGQKIATTATAAYHYPDASVFCATPVRDEREPEAFTNPTLLVEVLSPSTDRRGKLEHYRTLESLEEYVIVSIEDRTVERHRRMGPGQWLMTEHRDGDLHLAAVDAVVSLASFWVDLDRL